MNRVDIEVSEFGAQPGWKHVITVLGKVAGRAIHFGYEKRVVKTEIAAKEGIEMPEWVRVAAFDVLGIITVYIIYVGVMNR